MKNKLSYSQVSKYSFCGEAWRLHYQERYRADKGFSSLLFGSAIDKAMEYILLKDKVVIPEELKGREINEHDIFDYHWRSAHINDELVSIPSYPKMQYAKSDLDLDLLTQEEKEHAQGDTQLLSWYSLQHKGHLMLQAFKKDVLPKIKKVYSVQEEVNLESSDSDDSVIGFCDAVLELEGYDKPIVMDFKTSAKPYDESSCVQESAQLAQYLYTLGDKYNTDLAGYIVFNKSIDKNKKKVCSKCGYDGTGARHQKCSNEIDGKRCNGEWTETLSPSASIQIIVGTISETFTHIVIDNISAVNTAIKSGIFTKNIKGCFNNGWNRKCEYFNICHNNDSHEFIKKEVKV